MPTCNWMCENVGSDNMAAQQWGIRRGWTPPWVNIPPNQPFHRFSGPPPNIHQPPPLLNQHSWHIVPSSPRLNQNYMSAAPNAFQYRPNTRYSVPHLRTRRVNRVSRAHRQRGGHYHYPESDGTDEDSDDHRNDHRENNNDDDHHHNNSHDYNHRRSINRVSNERNNNNSTNDDSNASTDEDERCFICGEPMRNCDETCVHMCSGRLSDGEEMVSDAEIDDDVDMDVHEDTEDKPSKPGKVYDAQSPCTSAMAQERDLVEAMKVALKQEKELVTALRIDAKEEEEKLKTKEKTLKKLEKELKDKEQKMEKTHKENKIEITRLKQQLRDECKHMEEQHEIQKGRIKLDIGGHVYTTSTSTLTIDPNSMLAIMFSGRHDIIKQEDDTVFIDRDGTHFRHILNYLRDGPASLDTLPRPRQLLKELRNEAAFYQLPGLVQHVEDLLN